MNKYLFILLSLVVFTSNAQNLLPSADELKAMQAASEKSKVMNYSEVKTPMEVQRSAGVLCDSISTTYISNNGLAGAMFDVVAVSDLVINGLYTSVNLSSNFEVYYKSGSYVTATGNASAWTLAGTTSVTFTTLNSPVFLNIPLGIQMFSGDTIALYITNNSGAFGGLRYTDGAGAGTLYVNNGSLKVYEGIGITYPFVNIFPDRVWNGTINYCLGTTSVNNIENTVIQISPNPVNDLATFDLNNMEFETLILYNINGQIILKESINNSNSVTIDCSRFTSGLYIYELQTADGHSKKGKLILE